MNRSSRTAEHVALFRALETARRRDRVIDDPYAVRFLTGRYRFLARLARVPAARRWLERYLDRRFPGGPRASAVVRTRLIDELVDDALAGADGHGPAVEGGHEPAGGDGRDALAADGGREALAGGGGWDALSTEGGREGLATEGGREALAGGDGRNGLAADGGRDGSGGEEGRDQVGDSGGRDRLGGGRGQVVLLGAGYDSRAYRLVGLRSVRVFEVDHPATQATKRRLVGAAVGAERREQVRFVGVDLMRDDLAGALRQAGFSGEERTVVVWEGVTNYLTADAVDTTLRALAGIAAGGSRIVFTYVDRAALDGSGRYQGVWQDAVRRHGEPWTFGFDPDALPGYLAERGLRLMLDLSARDAADRYLVPLGRHEPAAAFYRIAQAEVR
ncbi:hypothetical protein GCM10009558_022500 [Virgisporangium aurantiacum]